ncbi:MAG: metallophosphoesterase family protein [Lachnospiraceae bacterium]|nr:metallophosphoesterase family protein [Lachnospiraceae bacterium]
MKIIHMADAHLDSRMESRLDKSKAATRREELIDTFCGIADYADENGVSAVIIAGDLFDTKNARVGAVNRVKAAFESHPGVTFYYLKGNHDEADYFEGEDAPSNLKLFEKEGIEKDTVKTGSGKDVVITGIVPGEDGFDKAYTELLLEYDAVNIVVMHGCADKYQAKDKAESIDLGRLKNKNIDYLALGHYHSFAEEELPSRGKYCYSGCIEGRGFDECGEKGFVLLDIDEETGKIDSNFIPFSKRNVYVIEADISECMTTPEIDKSVSDAIKATSATGDDIVRIVLTGETDVDIEKDIEHVGRQLNDRFYYAEVKDNSKIAIDYEEYLHEASLKGELVRLLKADDSLSEEERGRIVRCAIQALKGEEISL